MENLNMQTITIGKTRYTTNRTDIFAHHAKCTGKHKRVKSKGPERRFYPVYFDDMSTADYVAKYESLNHVKHLLPVAWDQLRALPCLPPVGEDSYSEAADNE
jgi:hypothetical protein